MPQVKNSVKRKTLSRQLCKACCLTARDARGMEELLQIRLAELTLNYPLTGKGPLERLPLTQRLV
jgi:hypothetical protein